MGFYRNFKHHLRKINRVRKLSNLLPPAQNLNTDLKIYFPHYNTPLVSIIIPFYNQNEYTCKCLRSISQNLPQCPFEVVLVNDNSTDPRAFMEIENIRVINNTENLGFLKSVNRAIKTCNTKYIYLLNNDTEVFSGFLDELLFVFKNFENVGAVGSMLLNSDGSLQEAGGVFLSGQKLSIIDGKKPYFPELNYIYKVDYCSGCSLMFERMNPDGEINLFDEQFSPAYFEDTDLCSRLRYNFGKEIYYTPFSKLIHHNGASYNRNVESTAKKQELFDKNFSLFKSKWGDKMSSTKAQKHQERILELNGNRSVVFFSGIVPEYDKNSGDLRLAEIIKTFKKKNYFVALISRQNQMDFRYNEYFQRLGVCTYYEHMSFWDVRQFLKRLKLRRPMMWFYAVRPFIKNFKSVKSQFPNGFFIYDMVDIHHLRYKRMYETEGKNRKIKSKYLKNFKRETNASKLADLTIAVSEDEKEYMSQFVDPAKIKVISNIHYLKTTIGEVPKFSERRNLLFVGSIHEPNIDAVHFLSEKIMPLVWQENPEIQVDIVGNVKDLLPPSKDSRILLHGYVPKMEDFLKNSRIMIAPLRYGAGVKGKIGQAFEYFLPVVTTEIGAEGMKLQNGENALIANTAEDFARQIIRLYNDEILWERLQRNSERSLYPFSLENLSQKIEEIGLF